MNNEQLAAQQFSAALDRLLAGEQPEAAADAETRETTALSLHLLAHRAEPSPQFQAQLRARLLDTLERTPAPIPWYSGWLPRRFDLRVATVMAVFVIALAVAALRFLPARAPATPQLLRISAQTDANAYRPGQPVTIAMTMSNTTATPLNLEHFPPIVSVMRGDNKAPAFTFAAGSRTQTLAPQQSVTFNLTWDQRDQRGQALPSGVYYLELEDLDYQGQALKVKLNKPVQFQILERS